MPRTRENLREYTMEKLRDLKDYDYFIILPDDPFKGKWDLIVTFILLFSAIMTPYRIAFFD